MSEVPNTEQKMAEATEVAPQESSEAEVSPTEDVSKEEEVVSDEPSEDVKLDQSDRAKSRQQELANRLKDSEIEKDNLRKELEKAKVDSESKKLEPVETEATESLDSSELSFEQLDKYIEQKADKKVNELLSIKYKEEARLKAFERGVSSIESKYKELNPDSDAFDSELSSTVTRLYREASKVDPSTGIAPDIDVYDFVQSVMSIRDSGADKAVSEVKKQTVLQEAASAVTPSSEKVVTPTTEEKLEELLKTGQITAKEAEQYLK